MIDLEDVLKEKYWFVICSEKGESGKVIGPILDIERARIEACFPDENGKSSECRFSHFVIHGMPGESMLISTPAFIKMNSLEREIYLVLSKRHIDYILKTSSKSLEEVS